MEHVWGDDSIDDLLTGLVPDEPWAEGVAHHFVVGRVRADPRHPLSLVFGDVVVVPVVARHRDLVRNRDVAPLLEGILASTS